MIRMQENMSNTLSFLDKMTIRYYDYLYTASIAKEAVSGKEGNSGGILIVGMIVVIVGLVGFILTKNRN